MARTATDAPALANYRSRSACDDVCAAAERHENDRNKVDGIADGYRQLAARRHRVDDHSSKHAAGRDPLVQ